MSNRRSFLRDAFMAASIALLPKILRPEIPEVKEENTKVLFMQLNDAIPDYLPGLIAKYGNVNFLDVRNKLGNQ